MTHTLHRQGTRENLSSDFTMIYMPAWGINDKASAAATKRFIEIALQNNAINLGGTGMGNIIVNSPQEILDRVTDGMSMALCCTSKESVINILKETIKADLGLSLVVQGVFEEVEDCLRQVGLKPHTVHHSLGVWGKTEKLPGKEVLEITTMCGHGLVCTNLAKKCIEDVISGSTRPREAARLLAQQCVCGVFNVSRAEALLESIALKSRAVP